MSELTLEKFLNQKNDELRILLDTREEKGRFVFSSAYVTINVINTNSANRPKKNPVYLHYTFFNIGRYCEINSKIYIEFNTPNCTLYALPETHAHLAFPEFAPYCQTLRENKRSLMTVFRGLEKIQKRKQEKERQALMLDERTQRDHWYRDHPLYGLFE